jgi:hypothetical protein
MSYVALFFAGALLCNSIPHLAAGLQGTPFPTPFARPRGVGNSSPLANFLWGSSNVAAGALLYSLYPIAAYASSHAVVFAAGALGLGAYLSIHFAKVRGPDR